VVAIAASPATLPLNAPPVPASTTTESTPWVPVDALPKAGPARTDGNPGQAGHTAPQAAVSGAPRAAVPATAPSRAPVRTPKRDPLSPW
jgi:hypothetical protein